jgi:uncharacterized protein (DUF2345 family)
MAHITQPAPSELIRTSTFGIPVTTELNTRCVKVDGTIGGGASDVANQWMTGSLVINANPALRLRQASNLPSLAFESTAGTVLSTIQGTTTQINHNVVSASGAHRFLVAGIEEFKVDSAGATASAFTTSTQATFAGNGAQVRLIDTSTSGSDFHDVYMAFYGAGVSLASPGVRTGYIGYAGSSTIQLRNEVLDGDAAIVVAGAGTISLASTTGGVAISATTGNIGLTTTNGTISLTATGTGHITLDSGGAGDINLISSDQIVFTSGGTYQGVIDGPVFLFGKAATDISNAGIELLGTAVASGQEGQIRSTIGATGSGVTTENLTLNRTGTANATNGRYIDFLRGGASTGGILERASAGIILDQAVVTAPSDYRWKDDLGPVADGLERVMLLRPRHVRWKDSGDLADEFMAHEVAAVYPNLVRGDKDAVDDAGAIVGQSLNATGLLPSIVAAIQELTVRVEALED